jgi:tetratricopeptide (TPR) repeat protein
MAVRSIDADLILELLHGLPLALTQAGSYLRETNMSTSTYVKYYNMTWKDLMKKESRYPLQEYADRSILTTWTMSYMQLKSQSEEAANLLKLWAFLDHGDLWYEMIAQAPKLTNDMDVPPWLLCTAKSDLEFCDSMGLLARYSLVDAGRGEADSYSMHSVLHKWCFYLCEDSERSKFSGLATGLVASLVPSEEGEYWKLQRRLLPHANRVYQMLPTNASEQASKADTAGWQAWIFYNLGMYFAEQDRLAEAETLYVAALAWYEQTLGREHRLTLDTAASLGNLYREQGKLTRAEQLLQRALEGRKLALGDEHILVFDTLSDLGNLFDTQDRLADAETQYHLALVGKEKLLEPDDPSILRTMNNLSALYWKQDQPERAEPLFQRVLSGHETRFGLTHPNTLAIVYNLGLFYRTRAPRKAEKMYLRALEGQVHELTVAHPRTLQTLNDLVVLYKEQGRLAEAETLLRRLVAGKETTHGTAHPVTLDLVAHLAVLCYRQGRFGPAEEMFERALAGFRDVLGPAHETCVGLDKGLLRCRELMAQSK